MKKTKKRFLPSRSTYAPCEMEIHYKRPLFKRMHFIGSSKDAVAFLKKNINLKRIDHKEFFWVILLNNANRIVGLTEIGAGSDSKVVINCKEIFQLALLTNASGFILAHCHPSGKLSRSHADKKLTKKILEMSKILDFRFLDHIIITSESHYSFAENNLV